MEPAAERKVPEQEDQLQQPSQDAPPAVVEEEDEAEAEETERRNTELKAGLHPLRVRPPPSSTPDPNLTPSPPSRNGRTFESQKKLHLIS
jgi:hypothetical protein